MLKFLYLRFPQFNRSAFLLFFQFNFAKLNLIPLYRILIDKKYYLLGKSLFLTILFTYLAYSKITKKILIEIKQNTNSSHSHLKVIALISYIFYYTFCNTAHH